MELQTSSPINIDKIKGQNKRLYEYLKSGNTINCMHPAMIELQIGYLNSRISDLVKNGIAIKKKFIKINDTNVVEYSLADLK